MNPITAPARLLVCRTDRLGDFMLAWPAFALLKQALPQTRLIALVPDYTRPIAELCRWLDGIVVDPAGEGIAPFMALRRRLRDADLDAAVAFYSPARLGAALALAGVSLRLAPASRLSQFLYSERLVQRRSASAKPEYEYNADLAREFVRRTGLEPPSTPQGPYLTFGEAELASQRRELAQMFGLAAGDRWIFVHAGHGGSARNLKPEQYADLCRRLAGPGRAVVFTAGPGEEELARQLAATLGDCGPTAVLPPEGLQRLARNLALADLFISGSTGPLHVAGALGRPTATFYPGHRSGSPLRWQTLNRASVRLAFTPPPGGDPKDVSRTDVAAAAVEIDAMLKRLYG